LVLVSQQKIDEYTAALWWGSETLWSLFARNLREQPGAEAVADAPNRAAFAHGAPQRWSWAQLGEQVDRFSHLLVEAGVRRDDVVVAMLPNSVEQFVLYLACARLGIVVTPVPVQYREHELDHILRITQAVAAVTFARIGKSEAPHLAAQMFEGLKVAHPALKSVFAWGESVQAPSVDIGARTSAVLTPLQHEALAAAQNQAAVTANDVFTICWTSGTEAVPKGVPRSHNEWLIVAPSIIEAAGIAPHARLLNPFPLVNMAGISTALVSWLVLGGTVIQHQPFSLPVFLQQLRDEQIDYTVAPPAILNTLLQDEQLLAGIDFERLARIGSGSAPLSDWMVRGFQDKHGVQIVNYFGSNEGAALSAGPKDIPEPELRARFFPRAGVKGYEWSVTTTRKIRTRLVDLETGEEIHEAGQPGEIRFRGPTIFSGYYGAPELTSKAFDEQGFYKTGDLFELAGDRLQYYRYVGRSKDLVIRGGMNISSEEIENMLLACPGVKDAAVVAVPDNKLGEKVCACIVAAEGRVVSLESLTVYLRDVERVATYKLPEYLLLVPSLPRNPVGKILKRELRQQAALLAAKAPA
jgi:acyl-CoA synthetase (AMP-forming)/AMP-acid ligase II